MNDFIEKLKRKSPGVRFAFAFGVTAAVIIPIVFIWAAAMRNNIVGTYEYQSGNSGSAEIVKSKSNGGLISVKQAVDSLAGDIWNFFSAALTQPYFDEE